MAAGRNLVVLAEKIGCRVTRTADDNVEARRMTRAEIIAGVEKRALSENPTDGPF